jgi:hypothetical protein
MTEDQDTRSAARLASWPVPTPEKSIAKGLNVGNFDRLLRILLGWVLICLAAIGTIGA